VIRQMIPICHVTVASQTTEQRKYEMAELVPIQSVGSHALRTQAHKMFFLHDLGV